VKAGFTFVFCEPAVADITELPPEYSLVGYIVLLTIPPTIVSYSKPVPLVVVVSKELCLFIGIFVEDAILE
jgi:hypothetical protein